MERWQTDHHRLLRASDKRARDCPVATPASLKLGTLSSTHLRRPFTHHTHTLVFTFHSDLLLFSLSLFTPLKLTSSNLITKCQDKHTLILQCTHLSATATISARHLIYLAKKPLSRTSPLYPAMTQATTSSSTSTSSAHPQHLESFGTHCSLDICNVSDLLPFTCQYCRLSYCGDHRLPASHHCAAMPPTGSSDQERRAAKCPLCSGVLPISDLLRTGSNRVTAEAEPDTADRAALGGSASTANQRTSLTSPSSLGGDDDVLDRAMELHLDSGSCPAMQTDPSGILLSDSERSAALKAAKERASNNICTYPRCRNRMWIDLRCERCEGKFCPTHREARAHRCELNASHAQQKGGLQPQVMQAAANGAANRTGKSGLSLLGKLKVGTAPAASGATPASPSSLPTTAPSSKAASRPSTSWSSPAPAAAATRAEKANGNTAAAGSATKPGASSGAGGGLLGKINAHSEEKVINKRAAAEQQAALLSLRNRAEKG